MAKDAIGAVLEDRSWVYDGQLRVIAEINASGALRARYLYASSGHSPDVAVTFDPNTGEVTGSYLLVHDQVGSVVRTVDLATGLAVESVEYDPWGVATVSRGGSSVHPFGFAGGLWDRRTGLVRFGARECDAGLGRWLARDPIGFGGGWNQYGYVANNPVGHADPSGLANYEHPMQWLPPDADIRAGSLLAEQAIADALTNMALSFMLWEIGGAFWARPYFQAGAACSGASKGVAANRLAGQAGESFLARTFGSRSQVTMQTSQGRRVIDNFTEGIARESKVGRTSLTSTVRGLMAKDAELLGSGRVEGVAWHFFPGQTGVGPTAPLQSALEKAEIGIVIH